MHSSFTGPGYVESVGDLLLQTTVTNIGDESIKLIKDPRSVLDALATDTFIVVNPTTGRSPVFTGVQVSLSLVSFAAC